MQDDPDLYVSKIKYIEENNVDDMDLVFSEEEYKDGHLDKVGRQQRPTTKLCGWSGGGWKLDGLGGQEGTGNSMF